MKSTNNTRNNPKIVVRSPKGEYMKSTAELAIREYCLDDCCCGNEESVKYCEMLDCPLHPYRADSEALEEMEIVVTRA